MERKPRIDFTREQWFSSHKSHKHGNLLLEVVDNFDYLQAFGNNTFEKVWVGARNYLDKLSGYVLRYDGTHICDRCGAPLDESGADRKVNMAYLKGDPVFKRRVGLCDRCDRVLAEDSKLYMVEKKGEQYALYWKSKPIPNDWERYIWL